MSSVTRYRYQKGVAKVATFVVAASNSSSQARANADYVCDGINDESTINDAIQALPAGGGKIVLLEGTYFIEDEILPLSNTTLEGCGPSTVLKIPDGSVWGEPMLHVIFINSKQWVTIKDLAVDGNKANTTGQFSLIKLNHPYDCIIERTYIHDSGYTAIHMEANATRSALRNSFRDNLITDCEYRGFELGEYCLYNIIENNRIFTCGDAAIYMSGGHGSGNLIRGNTIQGNLKTGIYFANCPDSIIESNIVRDNGEEGIYVDGDTAANLVVRGNLVYGNGFHGIKLKVTPNCLVSGNSCIANGQVTDNTYSNIFLESNADYCAILGNLCRQGAETNQPKYGIEIDDNSVDGTYVHGNDLYSSGQTDEFSDSGTLTVATDNRGV